MVEKDFCSFIFARGGSKGIKDKNIKEVAGKPLLAYAIECALGSKFISKVVVSTDSGAIAEVAKSFGAEVLDRPEELASDASPELLSWQHAVESYRDLLDQTGSPFISVPTTSPLRKPDDIDRAMERFQLNDSDLVLGISPSHRSPYLNMVKINENDHIEVVVDIPDATRRQDVPQCYDITTCLYVANLDYVMNTTRPIDGRIGYVEISSERALDIDTPFDLHLAGLLLENPFD